MIIQVLVARKLKYSLCLHTFTIFPFLEILFFHYSKNLCFDNSVYNFYIVIFREQKKINIALENIIRMKSHIILIY